MSRESGHGPGRFAGVRIPDPGFAGDAGTAPTELTAALAAYSADRGAYVEALHVLAASRLLVPVIAVLGEVEHDAAGRPRDKYSDMATVFLTGRDGRRGLLAFTGLDQLRAWNADARPVPVEARLAARSAVQEAAVALVVDVAGPTTLVVEGDDLRALAAGWTLARVGERAAWIRPRTE